MLSHRAFSDFRGFHSTNHLLIHFEYYTNIKGKVVPMVRTMAYRGRGVVAPLMPTSALVGSQCSASCPGRFTSGQNLKHKHITLNDYCFESQTDFSCLSLSLINTKKNSWLKITWLNSVRRGLDFRETRCSEF